MDVTFQKQEFLEKLFPCMGSVSAKNTIAAIEGVLIEADPASARIRLSSYDMRKGVIAYLDAEQISVGGSYIINAQKLAQIVRLLPDGSIHLSIDERNNATISGGNSSFSLLSMKGSEFPTLPDITAEKGFSMDSFLLKKMIQKVMHSIAEKDARHMLCGAFFQISPKEMTIISCDSFTLSKCHTVCDISGISSDREFSYSFIVPGHALNELVKIISEKGGMVEVLLNGKHGIFRFEDITFYTRLIEEDYIDYERIIPKDLPIRVKLNRERMIEGLERASLIAEEKGQSSSGNSYVKLILKEQMMSMTSKSVGGEVYDAMECTHEGEDLKIAFNCRYLLNSMRASEGEEICLSFKSSTQCVTITPEGEEKDSFFYMVLPVRMVD